METRAYEPLSPQDRSFLVFENAHAHMHVGGTAIFDAGPLRTERGGIDVDRIRAHVAARLALVPRYRQRLAHVPLENSPVWVDDEHFNLHYHVRHTALPCPGEETDLKRACSRIMSQQLDRGKPLWELWIVEGLGADRFAAVFKTHHCIADGISTAGFLSVLLSPTPDEAVEPSGRWVARPAPSRRQLLMETLLRHARAPFDLGAELGAALLDPGRLAPRLKENVTAISELLGTGLRPPAHTPLNGPIGPHRRLDWLSVDLREVKAIKNRFGVTVNDVVLGTVAGAVRRFLRRRRFKFDGTDFRAVIPVNIRAHGANGTAGNRVSGWLTALPIRVRDPRRRLAMVSEMTSRMKESKQELGVHALGRVAEAAGPAFLTAAVRLAARMHPYNLIVSNVPGPPIPLYLLGARMLEGYPLVPLFENQGLSVALLSYDGRLCWGLNADFDLVPDLHEFADAIRASFQELSAAAGGRS